MRGYMTMKQAFECGNDDFPFIEGSFNVNQTCQKTKREILDNWPTLSYDSALSDKWQVKTAEPRVLTPQQIHIKLNQIFKSDTFMNLDHIIELIKAGHQNGRLERDLELRPLGDAVLAYRDDYQAYEETVIAVLRNLKPLNPGG